MFDLWQGYFSNADLEGLLIVNSFHGGRDGRHFEFRKNYEVFESGKGLFIRLSIDKVQPCSRLQFTEVFSSIR